MPTLEHNGLVEMFRENPSLAPHFLAIVFHKDVPPHAVVQVGDSSLDQLIPVEFRADLVLELLDGVGTVVLAIVLEAQREKKPRKKYTWAVYWSVARAERECPAVVLVVAPDAEIATWAAAKVDLGLGLADRRTLVEQGQPITGASMVSMKHGPVLSEVLELINEGEKQGGPWADYISPPLAYEVQLKVGGPEADELSRYELRVLGEVHARFGGMDRWALVDWLHENIPEWQDPDGSVLPIRFADVLRAHDISEQDIQKIRREAEFLWAIGSLGR
jgi:Protein of unknown function (DUF4065)